MAIRHADAGLYFQDGVSKQWRIEVIVPGGANIVLDNDTLIEDSISLPEKLCSKQDIVLGSCESCGIEFEIYDNGTDLKGKEIIVTQILNGHTDNPVPIGKYIVKEETYEEDERIKKIKAWDQLEGILEKDFAEWFNALPEKTLTCKAFRDSFFEYAGIPQEETILCNDTLLFEFTVSNNAATQRMLEEENERIQQLLDAANSDVIVYDYLPIDLEEYDPSKKVTTVTNEKVVNPAANADPAHEEWYELVTASANPELIGTYQPTGDHHIVKYYSDIVEVAEQPGTTPVGLHLYEISYEPDPISGKKWHIEPTDDRTWEANKKYYSATATPKSYYVHTETSDFNPAELGWYIYVDGKPTACLDDHTDNLHNYFEQVEHPKPMPKYVEVVPREGQNPSELEWYEYDETLPEDERYFRSHDQTVDPNKTYYSLSDPKNRNASFLEINKDAHRHANPEDEHWYEFADDAYFRSDDQTVDPNKNYYLNIWDLNQNDQNDTISDEMRGAEIVQAICEINGAFGHIDRTGVFRYLRLKPIDFSDQGLYPDRELYPDVNLYPVGQPYDWLITRNELEEFERESYKVAKIDRLVICKEDGDEGYVYPAGSRAEGHNTYKITGNFIWYSFTDKPELLETAGMNILTYGIGQISEYTPCEFDLMGNPCIEVGDTVKLSTRLGDIYTYVLSRTLKAGPRFTDTIEAKGSDKRQEDSTIYQAMIELKGKSNILTRNVDMTRSEIVDMSAGLSSLIEQTAESIKMGVSREVKIAEDNSKERYQSSIEYTDRMISQTVSKTVYDEKDKETEEWKSGILIEYDHITAEVTQKVSQKGEENGFKWDLLSSGFTLWSKGGYEKVNFSATGSMEVVVPAAGANPAEEWWHERVDNQWKLTVDTEVQPGKTYYKSTQDPSALNWYEIRNGYELTNDKCIHENKSYYTQRSASADYKKVFECNSGGIIVDGTIRASDLDIDNVASFGMIHAIDAKIENLKIRGTLNAADIVALRADLRTVSTNALTAETIRGVSIAADQITSGRIQANQINMDFATGGWFSGKTVCVQGNNSHFIADYASLDRTFIEDLNIRFTASSWLSPTWHEEIINGRRYFILAYKP